MAAPKFPTLQLFSPEFLICAGAILFQPPRDRPDSPLQVCILFHPQKDEYLLPKGRKDISENPYHTALRETYEETGYPCDFLPVRMHTRAPQAGEDIKDTANGRELFPLTEPFAMTFRNVGGGTDKNYKMIWWFIAKVTGEKQEGTMTASEGFQSCWFSETEVVEKLTFESDRDVVRKALELVRATYVTDST
ncbi:hypothetical protein BOTBODRAFT_36467 [Botryobasidium botryosum FD-172 SS1]|uniref:Nudix hydrolase domain-containing protein n=1 Tax=Botryobasidium botryosum (strain FD-172 SS1) TaxID=930990 RepID=A0A067M652_BOTB1|nr:hypothetical protein BOTBODRAFT_36467 [Botryobasidium botryosum FD-172 SS1]